MARKDEKYLKKLIGVYKACINACTFNKNTKGFRIKLKSKIDSL